MKRTIVPLGALLLAAACSGGGGGAAAAVVVPAGLAFRVQPATSTAGAVIPVAVSVVDAAGDVVASADLAVTVELAGPGVLQGAVVRNAVAGVATFDDLRVEAAGSYTMRAVAAGLASATSGPFDVVPAAAAALRFRTQPGAPRAFDPLPALEVEVVDDFGNLVASAGGAVTLEFETAAGADREVLLHASGFGAFDLVGNGSVDAPFEAIDPAGPALLPPLPGTPRAQITAMTLDPAAGDVLAAEAAFLSGDFVAIDPATGDATVLGSGVVPTDLAGLAFDATGTVLLGVAHGDLIDGPDLYAIDPVTGAATFLGPIAPVGAIAGDTILGFNGLAREPGTGTLYAAARLAGAGTFERTLVELDPISRTARRVGTMGDRIGALAFTADGTLYGATDGEFAEGVAPLLPETLFVVDTSDGTLTPVLALGNGTPGEALVAVPAPAVLTGTVADVDQGVAVFRDVVIDGPATGYRLRASSPGLRDAVTGDFEVRPADDTVEAGFARAAQDAGEGVGLVQVEVVLDRAVPHEVVVGIDTLGILTGASTAEGGGVDHDLNEGHVVVRIPAGATTATLEFAVTDDAVAEPDETLTLRIAGVALGTAGAAATHTITILDDD